MRGGRSVRVLHVAAEVFPLLKTGGLADVAGALPDALHAVGADVRVLMPGYGAAVEQARQAGPVRVAAEWPDGRLLQTALPGGCPLWLYETDAFAARGERPFDQSPGVPWPDNAERFDEFARVATALADNQLGLEWRADIVHAHDWHAGLVPVHMQLARVPAATVFTIHNLAYQGLFPLSTRAALGLPGWLEHWEALEFHGQLSFIKGGIAFADRVTTVSATYAEEITTPALGAGLDGLLASRRADLSGITNGIDMAAWNPATDSALPAHFDVERPQDRRTVRANLLDEVGFDVEAETPILAYIGRLAEQKGVDLLVDALEDIVALPAAVIVLGSGDPLLEDALQGVAERHPTRVHCRFGFDEAFAHRIYGGADMLLMPSRFEPCGLGQLYAMRYGAIPVVHSTGGLAETVVDTTPTTLAEGRATGFRFDGPNVTALLSALERATAHFHDAASWRRIVDCAMRRDSSWTRSAHQYLALYDNARSRRHINASQFAEADVFGTPSPPA